METADPQLPAPADPAVIPASLLATPAAADAPASPDAAPNDYGHVWPLLSLLSMAAECLMYTAVKPRLTRDMEELTDLTLAGIKAIGDISDLETLQRYWREELPDYHFTLLIGRLALEGPLTHIMGGLVCASDLEDDEYESWRQDAIAFARNSQTLNEHWLVGLANAETLPSDPDTAKQLALLVRRRERLEKIAAEIAPALRNFVRRTQPVVDKVTARKAQPAEKKSLVSVAEAATLPERRGPFLRRAFTDLELAAVRLLLTHVPGLATLLPDYPLALAMQTLSGFTPPARVAALHQRFAGLHHNQTTLLTLDETLTLLQVVHGGALLLLRGTLERLTRQLRRRLTQEDLPDAVRENSSGLLLLLTDPDTYERFRHTFGPLTQRLAKAVDQTFPHHPAVVKARTEVAELAVLI